MDILLTLYDKDVFSDITEVKGIVWKDRPTGKAVLFDSTGKVALMGNNVHDFLLLPGGGLEEGESITEGIQRECLEETGCAVEVGTLVGVTEDFRQRDGKRYINHCYFAKAISCGKSAPTDNEAEIGTYVRWMPMEEAVNLLFSQVERVKTDGAKFYNTSFNVPRDYFLIRRAQELMNKGV